MFDEFQDTSIRKWRNLVPLVHESLSKGGVNLLVGDAKQAIYRWREGDVDQFLDFCNKYKLEIEKAQLDCVNDNSIDLCLRVKESVYDPKILKNISYCVIHFFF